MGDKYETIAKNIFYRIEGNKLIYENKNKDIKHSIADIDFNKDNWKVWVAFCILNDLHNQKDWAREEAMEYFYKYIDKNFNKSAWDIIQIQANYTRGGEK